MHAHGRTERNALSAEKAHLADQQAYTQVRAELVAIEPALTFDAAADQPPTAGSVAYAAGGTTVTLATRSRTAPASTSATPRAAARPT